MDSVFSALCTAWFKNGNRSITAYLIQRHFWPRPCAAGVSPGLGTSRSGKLEADLRSSSSAGLGLPLGLSIDRPRRCSPHLPAPGAAPGGRRAACTATAWPGPSDRRGCRPGATLGPRAPRPPMTGAVLPSPACVLAKPPSCRLRHPKLPQQLLSEGSDSPCCTWHRFTPHFKYRVRGEATPRASLSLRDVHLSDFN